MLTLKYVGEKTGYEVSFKNVNQHVVQITGYFPVKQKGFLLYRDGVEEPLGDYTDYKTVYREVEQGAQFSDNGSVYSVPLPIVLFAAGYGGSITGEAIQEAVRYEDLNIPTPTPDEGHEFIGWHPKVPTEGDICGNVAFQAVFAYIETIDEAKEKKVAEMNAVQQEIITAGIDVKLTDCTIDHFDLTDRDQMRLMGLQTQVASGAELISWHTSDEDEHCKFYSNADMALIVEKAVAYVTWHVTYFRDLRIYIRSLETKEEVTAVEYGMDIPVEYQSDPLKVMIAAQAAGQEV